MNGGSFLKGLLTGGLIGAMASMMIKPQLVGGPPRKMLGKTRKMQNRANRIFREVKDGFSGMMKK